MTQVSLTKQQILLGVIGACVCLSMLGCRPRAPRQPLEDRDPIFLIPAIKQAAREERATEVPRLIQLLESEDAAIRLYAIGALRDLTDRKLGYEFYEPREKRREAVERWRQWAIAEGFIDDPAR